MVIKVVRRVLMSKPFKEMKELAMQISGSFQAEDPVWQGQEAVRGPGLEQGSEVGELGDRVARSHRRKLTGMPLAAVLSVDCQGQGQEQGPARGPFSKSGKIWWLGPARQQ